MYFHDKKITIPSGILRDKTMENKLMINKITPSVDSNYWLVSLDTMKVPKVFRLANKKNKFTKLWVLV